MHVDIYIHIVKYKRHRGRKSKLKDFYAAFCLFLLFSIKFFARISYAQKENHRKQLNARGIPKNLPPFSSFVSSECIINKLSVNIFRVLSWKLI